MSQGLYRSSTTGENMFRAATAEFIGTFFLVFIGTATAVTAALQRPIAGTPTDSLGVALAFGLTLAALVYALGHTSGCHLNPAVTIGLMLANKFPGKYALTYVVSQLAGATFASFLVGQCFGSRARREALLGVTKPADGLSGSNVLAIEAILTFFLVLVIMAVATDERAHPAVGGLAVGFTLFGAVLVAGPYTGGAINPARALGPMLILQQFEFVWYYVGGTLLGGVIGAIVYVRLLEPTVEPSEAEADS